MQTTKRHFEPSVVQRLLDEPHRFQFAQAVRVLLQWLRQNDVAPDQALSHIFRFENSVSLAFAAGQIEALTATTEQAALVTDSALLAAVQRGDLKHIRITPTFMGFLGLSGVLPVHYTERIASQQEREKDHSARAFLDLFSSRLLALSYQTWEKYRLESSLDVHGKDAFLPMLMALGGIRPQSFAGQTSDGGGVSSEVAGYYAGLLRQRPISATAIESVLSEYFGLPIVLEQFVGGWDCTEESKLSKLGVANVTLGHSGALGVRKWRHDLRVRIRIGPLNRDNLDRFLPGAKGAKALEKMLSLFAVDGLQYQARLVIAAESVQPIVLAGHGAGRRLGWDSFLVSTQATEDKSDICYRLRPS